MIEYLRTGKRFPSARLLTSLYSKAFLIAAIIWFVSAFVPPPIRFVLWIMALALDISTRLVFTHRLSKRFAPHMYHLPDCFGTFAINHSVRYNNLEDTGVGLYCILHGSTYIFHY